MMRRLVLIVALAFLAVAQGAHAAREDVLVVVNDNSTGSATVGQYYAQQRGIDTAHIVHVKVPDQYTVTWTDFLSLRDQILRFGICPTVASNLQPAACSDSSLPIYTAANVATLTANTPIRYIVTTLGVPTEMTVDDSILTAAGAANSPTSVDNYLMYMLARYFPAEPVTAPLPTTRAVAFGDGRGMRTVEPATDGQYIIGRIDGANVASAEALVDRAIYAENNGIYGNLYGDTFGSGGTSEWVQYMPASGGNPVAPQPIYQPSGDVGAYWRYAFGLFDESEPLCSDYQTNYLTAPQTSTAGEAPSSCVAQFRWGNPNESVPGYSGSREPQAVDALAYFGSLDGQTIQGGFNTLLNWRKYGMGGAQVTLCANAADPTTCEANSTDPYQEINTSVVGVASGFIGYNFQSFPVSRLGIWPTGWTHNSVYKVAVPVVVNTDGVDNSYSLWYEQPDEVSNPQCYVYTVTPNGSTTPVSGTLSSSLQSCPSHRSIDLAQTVANTLDPSNPPTFQVSFYLKGSAVTTPASIDARLIFEYQLPSGGGNCPTPQGYSLYTSGAQCQYTSQATVSVPAGNSAWTLYTPLASVAPPAVSLTFEDLVLDLNGFVTAGSVGFDEISVKNLTTSTELVTNGSFDQGHEQTAPGDWAANFLDRLGGTAFWGSLSHHQSSGYSFNTTSLGTLVYFMRGLPLGDAVWLGDPYVSGILYGDPLYSPIAVKFDYLNTDSDNRITSSPALSGMAVNGYDPAKVSTSYAIDYCPGSDFYTCDQLQSWVSTGLSGTGGQATDQSFGTWDISSLPFGHYTLRLAVTSTNATLNRTQTFDDYYTVLNRYSSAEIPTYFISGTVTNSAGQPMSDVTVHINDSSGFASSVTTNANGYYIESGLKNNDTYLVWPADPGYTAVASYASINDASIPDLSFTVTQLIGAYSISGTVTDSTGQPMSGVTVNINTNSGFASSVTTNVNGYYAESGLQDDTYLVWPAISGYNSNPSFETINGGSISGVDFTVTQAIGDYSISGTVTASSGQPIPGVTVNIKDNSGFASNVTTNANGYYTESGLQNNDTYLVQPTAFGYSVFDTSLETITGANITGVNFTGTAQQSPYSISGFILSNGAPVSGVTVTVTDGSGSQVVVTTDTSGYYTTKGVLKDGVYTITPTLSGYTFTADSGSNSQTILGGNIISKNFTGTLQ